MEILRPLKSTLSFIRNHLVAIPLTLLAIGAISATPTLLHHFSPHTYTWLNSHQLTSPKLIIPIDVTAGTLGAFITATYHCMTTGKTKTAAAGAPRPQQKSKYADELDRARTAIENDSDPSSNHHLERFNIIVKPLYTDETAFISPQLIAEAQGQISIILNRSRQTFPNLRTHSAFVNLKA